MGGHPPLGYRVENRKLLVEPAEAGVVLMIFRRYLELGSMLPLLTELHNTGVKTRARVLSSGKPIGGIPFTKGPLAHLLKNRTYLGELNHRDKSYPGEHLAIIDRDLFDAVQAQLRNNLQLSRVRRRATGALLAGKIFDDRGNRMTPTYSKKKGARYHYYACRLLTEGRRLEAGSVQRVSAADIDNEVAQALRGCIDTMHAVEPSSEHWHKAVDELVQKVAVHQHQIVVCLTNCAAERIGKSEIIIPWTPKPGRPKREIRLPHSDENKDKRPIKSETRTGIVGAVAMGRRWLSELASGEASDTEALARRENRSKRSIHMLISLAFVAPDIVEALIEGKLPRGIGITKLVGLPPNWSEQRQTLGIETG